MNIGKIRPARLGEEPTHYALEDVRAGEGVVLMGEELRDYQRVGMRSVGVRCTAPVHLPRAILVHVDTARILARRDDDRSMRRYIWAAIIIASPLLLILVVRITQQIIGILTGGSI